MLCDYCLLLQHPGMPKHKKDSWQSTRGSHAWSLANHAKSTTRVTFSLRVKTFLYSPPRISLHRHSYLSKTHSLADKPHLHICLVIRMRLRIWNPICLSFQHPRAIQLWETHGEAPRSDAVRETPPFFSKLPPSSPSCNSAKKRSLPPAEPSWIKLIKLEILESLENVLDTGHTLVANVGYRLLLWWTSIVESFSKII